VAELIGDGEKYYLEPKRFEGTELRRARAPTVRFLVRQALRCQSAEELGERLRKRYQRQNQRRHALTDRQMREHFQLEHEDTIGREALQIRPGCLIVTMRDAANPLALKWALARTDTEEQDVVVLTARMVGAGGPELLDASEQSFSEHEQMLFTKAVSVAESFGKHVNLLVVPAGDIFAALVQTANSLEATSVVSGISSKLTPQEQAYYVGQAWEALPEPKRQFTFDVVMEDGSAQAYHIGPHAPHLVPPSQRLARAPVNWTRCVQFKRSLEGGDKLARPSRSFPSSRPCAGHPRFSCLATGKSWMAGP